MHRHLIIAIGAFAWLASCLGTIDVPPETDDGSGGLGGANNTTDGGGGGVDVCHGPSDFFCDEPADCECTACQPAAGCNDGQGCLGNLYCDLAFEDVCSCADCDWDARCLDLTGNQCVDDGICAATEGCSCNDCKTTPQCSDNDTYCLGAPNGICEAPDESCSCSDCLGDVACVCPVPGMCDFVEPCICPDCWAESICFPYCNDDGVCDWDIYETCDCADCVGQPLCAGFP